jgi:DNA-binding MarR family transcriptional regulator
MAVTDLEPLDIWRRAMVANVRRDAPDLSARQMAVLLTVYMIDEGQTVRGLAEILNVSKPAITRAIDRLGEFSLVRRKTDPNDRRSVIVQRTVKGSVYLAEFAEIIKEATQERDRDRIAAEAREAKANKMDKQPAAENKTPASAAKSAKSTEPIAN